MDLFAFHPYPRSSLDSLKKGLEWPMAGYANLDRVKQGLWDAFNGTHQPTTETGLGIMIDEIGWQVRVASSAPDSPYTGVENVPVTTEAKQAAIYGQLVRSAECDHTLKDLFFLPFIDETSLTGFQSGLLRADGSERPSYTTVTNAIASTDGRCVGRRVVWKHARTVLGAHVFFHGLAVPKVVREAARVGLRRPHGRGRTVRRDRRAREPVEARHGRRAPRSDGEDARRRLREGQLDAARAVPEAPSSARPLRVSRRPPGGVQSRPQAGRRQPDLRRPLARRTASRSKGQSAPSPNVPGVSGGVGDRAAVRWTGSVPLPWSRPPADALPAVEKRNEPGENEGCGPLALDPGSRRTLGVAGASALPVLGDRSPVRSADEAAATG